MNKRENKEKIKGETKIMFQELEGDPYQKFNMAFVLMAIIPLLVTLYLVTTRLFTLDILSGDIGLIFFFTTVIILCGLYVSYGVIKNILKRLMQHAREARRSNELKSMFLAYVSHELKNPLAVLLGNTESMIEGFYGEIKEKQKEKLWLCWETAGRMNRLVGELLDIYKIEAGEISMDKKKCDLIQIFKDQLSELDVLIWKKNLKIKKEFPKKALDIMADRDKMTQIINNLLSNAIKYSPEGTKIEVKVFPSGNFARMEFKDSASAIPADKLEKIFDKFERLKRPEGGTGIGLSIVRDLVELHEGRIWAENTPDGGNRFIVILPLVK